MRRRGRSTNPNALCGTFGGMINAFPCFDGSVGTTVQPATRSQTRTTTHRCAPLFDLGGAYLPFSTIPGAVEAASGSYETPFAATVVLNFKHDKFAISPQFQFFEGGYYGDPLTGYGVNPATCAALTGTVSPAIHATSSAAREIRSMH